MTNEQKSAYVREYFEREGIELDAEAIERNDSARAVAKLMANSLWG